MLLRELGGVVGPREASRLLPGEYVEVRPGVDDGNLAAAYGVGVSATEGLTRRPALAFGWPGQALSVLGLIAFEIIGTIGAAQQQPEREPVDALAIALVVGSALPLLARRRFPLSALLATHSVVLAYLLLDYPRGPIFLSPLIAFFSAVLLGRRVGAWIVLAIGFVASVMLPTVLGDEPAPTIGEVLGFVAWLLVVAGAAEIVRVRRERVAAAARMQEEEERRHASEERLAIARELHDVLAHNISMINVQAGVALHLLEERPDQARPALTAIKHASKEALTELRSVLGVLRRVDEEDGSKDPSPTLARLDDLVVRANAAGLSVRKEVEGPVRLLPAPVELAGFRIVQEALTNVVRHAAATRTTVSVTYGDDSVTVQVDDDGRGTVPSSPESGSGIVGMRERAESVGGFLEAGPGPEGSGFRVRAWLPLGERS